MKITVLQNNVIDKKAIIEGLTMAQNLLADLGLKVDFTYKDVDLPLKAFPISTDVVSNGFMIGVEPILNAIDGTEDIGLLIYNWHKLAPFDWGSKKPLNPATSGYMKGRALPMQIPEQWYGEPPFPHVLTEFFLHELCHALYMLTGQSTVDKTHFQSTSAYNQKQSTEYYKFLLTGLIPKYNAMYPVVSTSTVKTYPNFNPKSDPKMVGVKSIVMDVVQKVRTMVGFPISLSSGVRTVAQNKAAKGADNSAHLKGLAVDIPCTDPVKRTALIKAILTCGTPVFLEIAVGHLHIDLDSSIHPLGNTIVVIDD